MSRIFRGIANVEFGDIEPILVLKAAHDVQERVQEARDRIHDVQERLAELQARATQRFDDARDKKRPRAVEGEADGGDERAGHDGPGHDHAARDSDDARLD